jgi:hypothetical protein
MVCEEIYRIQSPQYLALKNVRDKAHDEVEEDLRNWHEEDYDYEGMNRLCMLQIVKENPEDTGNFIELFPFCQAIYESVKDTYTTWIIDIQNAWDITHENIQMEKEKQKIPYLNVISLVYRS